MKFSLTSKPRDPHLYSWEKRCGKSFLQSRSGDRKGIIEVILEIDKSPGARVRIEQAYNPILSPIASSGLEQFI